MTVIVSGISASSRRCFEEIYRLIARIDSRTRPVLRLVEREPVRLEPVCEAGALRDRGLPRLVLGPAVEFRDPEPAGLALAVLDRMARVAPPVVAVHRFFQPGIVVAVDMHGSLRRQAHADKAGLRRVAETEPRNREYLVGQ